MDAESKSLCIHSPNLAHFPHSESMMDLYGIYQYS